MKIARTTSKPSETHTNVLQITEILRHFPFVYLQYLTFCSIKNMKKALHQFQHISPVNIRKDSKIETKVTTGVQMRIGIVKPSTHTHTKEKKSTKTHY